MVKRKEVKIDEEQIRNMMTGDIPAAVMDNLYGDNAPGSQKEKTAVQKRLTYPTKRRFPIPVCPAVRKKRHPRSFERMPDGEGTAFRNIPNICLTTTL